MAVKAIQKKSRTKVRYRIVEGSRIPRRLANLLGRELTLMTRNHGGQLQAADVVDDAARWNKRYPTVHSQIEWDVVRASRLYQESQARKLLGSIEIELIGKDGSNVHVRAFHTIELELSSGGVGAEDQEVERYYLSLERISADPEMIDQVIHRAKNDLKTWNERYGRFRDTIPEFSKALAPVFQALDKL